MGEFPPRFELQYVAQPVRNPSLAGWSSWLSRIVNTDEVAGSSPALVNFFFLPIPFLFHTVMSDRNA